MQIEIPLPAENRYHSVFACPVSKDQSTEQNPPMMMSCGHVVSKDSLHKLSKVNGLVACFLVIDVYLLTDRTVAGSSVRIVQLSLQWLKRCVFTFSVACRVLIVYYYLSRSRVQTRRVSRLVFPCPTTISRPLAPRLLPTATLLPSSTAQLSQMYLALQPFLHPNSQNLPPTRSNSSTPSLVVHHPQRQLLSTS